MGNRENVLASAYRLKLDTWRQRTGTEVAERLALLRGAPAQQFAELQNSGNYLISSAIERCERAVDELIIVHLDQHDTQADTIADRIRSEFVEPACEVLPGAGLFVSGRGNGQAASRLRSEMEARFNARTAALIASIPDRVVQLRQTHKVETRFQRLRRWSENSRVFIAVSLLLAVLSLFDITIWTVWRFVGNLIARYR